MKEKHVLIIQIVIVILMLIALYPGNPYSYYIMLRFASFAAFGYLAYLFGKRKKYIWLSIFILLAIRFNPFMPFYSSRSTWTFFNIVAAIVTGVSIFVTRRWDIE
ncbi:MAG: DUF6804 family protein [Candidatus Cloacimonadaceae bacterium]